MTAWRWKNVTTQAQVCCDESQETRPPQVATLSTAFLPSLTTRSHFATMHFLPGYDSFWPYIKPPV